MTIDSLADIRLFRQIVASGGIGAAARALRDNKNRVSQRFAALERALGCKLANRTTRSFRLTGEGERFHEATEAIVSAVEVAVTATRPDASEGTVRLAIRSALLGMGIGDELARLLRHASGLRLQVTTVDDEADAAALASQAFDLAVQVRSLRDSTLVAKRLAEVKFSLCASPAYLAARGRVRSPTDLRKHECIRRLGATPETTWDLVHTRSGRRVRAPIDGRFECSDARLQVELLHAGFGIGLRPAAEVRRGVDKGTLESVLPGYTLAPIPVWIVAPRGRLAVPRVAHVANAVGVVVAGLA